MSWKDIFRLGPGHRGKAEIVPQHTYQWQFVELTNTGHNSWVMSVFTRPGREGGHLDIVIKGPVQDAIARASEANDEAAENYRQQRRRKRIHEEGSTSKRGGHRPGPMRDCPICSPPIGRIRR